MPGIVARSCKQNSMKKSYTEELDVMLLQWFKQESTVVVSHECTESEIS
jgi:hypothetical protein